MLTVYISIGNSDDKLKQAEWSAYCAEVQDVISANADATHGVWFSDPSSPWQNMCWCVAVEEDSHRTRLRNALRRIAGQYRQDSIAWAEVPSTEFLSPP